MIEDNPNEEWQELQELGGLKMATPIVVVNNKGAAAKIGADRVAVTNGKAMRGILAERVRIVNNANALAKIGARRVIIVSSTLGKVGATPVHVVNLEALDELGIDY